MGEEAVEVLASIEKVIRSERGMSGSNPKGKTMSGEPILESTIDHIIGETAAIRALITALVRTHPDRDALVAAITEAAEKEKQRIQHMRKASHAKLRASMMFDETLNALQP